MLDAGLILYISNFHFNNGNPDRNKYFIVLHIIGREILVASLPTKQDHVPGQIVKRHGCLNDDSIRFNCYYFQKNRVITKDTGFSFPLDTYVYGEQVDTYSVDKFNGTYTESVDYEVMGRLSDDEFMQLKSCLSNSGQTKRKIRKLL